MAANQQQIYAAANQQQIYAAANQQHVYATPSRVHTPDTLLNDDTCTLESRHYTRPHRPKSRSSTHHGYHNAVSNMRF